MAYTLTRGLRADNNSSSGETLAVAHSVPGLRNSIKHMEMGILTLCGDIEAVTNKKTKNHGKN